MGVAYVTEWQPKPGHSIQDSVKNYFGLLEMLGAEKIGNFTLECESFHRPLVSNSKNLHIIKCSDFPATCFVKFEDGPSIISDSQMTQFLSRLSSVWQPKKGGKLEIKGQSYKFEDFNFKVGVVSQASLTIGISLEVEYIPCVVPDKCWGLISSILRSILGDQAPTTIPSILASKESEHYKYEITSHQYLDLLINIRSTAR